MDENAFARAAREIVGRNVGDSVHAVAARFDPEAGRLVMTYYLHTPSTEEDCDDCELACAELAAAFPEIRSIDSRCEEAAPGSGEIADLVYRQ